MSFIKQHMQMWMQSWCRLAEIQPIEPVFPFPRWSLVMFEKLQTINWISKSKIPMLVLACLNMSLGKQTKACESCRLVARLSSCQLEMLNTLGSSHIIYETFRKISESTLQVWTQRSQSFKSDPSHFRSNLIKYWSPTHCS